MRRIGLIGLGKIARERHVPTIDAHPAFTLVGVADPHGDLSAHGVPGFRSHHEMLAAIPDLDAVAICTPPGARYRIALDVLAAGKDVLLEKPPAATVAEVAELRSAADRSGRVLFTAWHSQHNEAVSAARSYLAAATIRTISIVWKEDIQKYHPGQAWLWQPGGFGVFDPGINALSILTRILPRPAFVRGAELFIPDGADTPITARLDVGIEGQQAARGDIMFDGIGEGGDLREITVTTEAGAVLRLVAGASRLLVDDRIVVDGDRAEYPRLYHHFDKLIATRESDIDPAPLALVIAALQSGHRVPVAALT
jgi:D-galactose 1-dehydrogenase